MLHVHRAERADGLVDALRELLADAPPDPFAPEVVAVPTRGMERWLTHRLADRLGICANVEFPSPRRLVGDAVADASGVDPEQDPWLPERAVWPLLEVVDGARGEPWLAPLSAHLEGSDHARRFTTVRHVARLFDSYALQRPGMLRAWARGEGDGWQPELWRRLRDRVAVPDPADRLARACARLREDPLLTDLPPRLSAFGLPRLPAGHLEVLAALAAGRDVHVFLLPPSPVLWERIAAGGPPAARRKEDPTADLVVNRLLASWGQDARELQLVLAAAGAPIDHHHPVPLPEDTLLARLQAGVREDRPP